MTEAEEAMFFKQAVVLTFELSLMRLASRLLMDSVGVPHSQIFRPKASMIVASYGSNALSIFRFWSEAVRSTPFRFPISSQHDDLWSSLEATA